MIRVIHRYAGLVISIFILMHLSNHLFVFGGEELHISMMDKMRHIYRQPIIEGLLLICVFVQVISGINFFLKRRTVTLPRVLKWQLYSGLYMAFFLIVHVSAVLIGRFIIGLDTNLYFGAAGINIFPFLLFFIPYYFLAVVSTFTHIACLLYLKSKNRELSLGLLALGFILATIIIIGMSTVDIPVVYRDLYN